MPRFTKTASILGAMTMLAFPAASLGAGTMTLVSRAPDGTKGTDQSHGTISDHSISADGRLVVFDSEADNLSEDDDDLVSNVYVRDVLSGTTELVSRASGAKGEPADSDSTWASVISGDGRYVMFTSYATNLVGGVDRPGPDVFLRDLKTMSTTLVSRANGSAGVIGNDISVAGSLSYDGKVAVFLSIAENLSGADTQNTWDVYARHVNDPLSPLNEKNTLVSRADGLDGPGADGDSSSPSVSADGNRVAFASVAGNLRGDAVKGDDVWIRDIAKGTTRLVSRATGVAGAAGTQPSSKPEISADGNAVAFQSQADNLSAIDDDAYSNIFVRDMKLSTTTLISTPTAANAGPAAGDSTDPTIATSGATVRVAFTSAAKNLAPGLPHWENIYLRDASTGITSLVSRGAGVDGKPGDEQAFAASLTPDGTRVTFESSSTNLMPEDGDLIDDIFIREL